jgi:hypothetical protein
VLNRSVSTRITTIVGDSTVSVSASTLARRDTVRNAIQDATRSARGVRSVSVGAAGAIERADEAAGTPGSIVIEGVGHWEVRLWIIGGFDAVCGLDSGFEGPERATEAKSTLISHQELIGIVLKQACGAQ